jgi:hypothetical protein
MQNLTARVGPLFLNKNSNLLKPRSPFLFSLIHSFCHEAGLVAKYEAVILVLVNTGQENVQRPKH